MSGAHRSTTQTSAASVSKSAFWLLQLTGAAAAILVQLALLAFIGYTLITQPSRAWPLPLAVALGVTVCLGALGQIVWHRMERTKTRSS